MGYGSYSHEAHEVISRSYATKSTQEVFKQSKIHPLMDPKNVKLRESCDSETHPNSLGIIFALDVTGSMAEIPAQLAKKELPSFMKILTDTGTPDPQILFTAIGDATCDSAPLQIGQFESAAKEMDFWLTNTFLERGGGGTNSESYDLAFYFAARHTRMDCWDKRNQKGFLFLTGDENPYPSVSRHYVKHLIANEIQDDIYMANIVEEVKKTYEPYFLIPDQGRRSNCEAEWRRLLGNNVICLDTPADTCYVAAALVGLGTGTIANTEALAEVLKTQDLSKHRIEGIIRAVKPAPKTSTGKSRQ